MHYLFYDISVVSPMKLLASDVRISIVLLITLICLFAWKYRNFTKKYEGFPSYPLLTSVIYTYALREFPRHLSFTSFVFQKMITVLKQFQREGLCILWLGEPVLVLYGEKAVKIFSNEQAAVDKSYHYGVVEDAFGTGLVTSNGETWKKHRKLLNPVFHVGQLKCKLAIFNEKAENLVKQLSSIEDKTSIDIHQYLKRISYDILWESIMGSKSNTTEHLTFRNRCLEIAETLSELTIYRYFHPWYHYKFMLNFMFSGRKFLNMYDEIQIIFEKVVLDMKNCLLANKCNKEEPENWNSKSFTHILVEHHLKDPTFTLQDIKDEVITFVAAGYDTVSYALLWCLFLLGHHPDIQEQVYNEVKSLPDEHVTYEDLYNLKYLECVIKETLRIYPPIPGHTRRINKDIQYEKYLVPKGTTIAFCPFMLHRDPSVYPDPEKFIPERFQDVNTKKSPWLHIPFSEGIRSCIGKKFAMMEITVILTYILRNFKVISLESVENIDLAWNMVLVPTKPMHMQFISRKLQNNLY